MLAAQNTGVAQTVMGINDFSFMELLSKSHKVLYMFTTGTVVHAQKSSASAFQSPVTLQSITKQRNTEHMISWVWANVPQVSVQSYVLTVAKNMAFHNLRLTHTGNISSTLLHTCGLQNVFVANGFCLECCSPSRFLLTTAYKRPARIEIQHN